jgi:CDP-diacylglycerol--serine O-phosphatidyltransferase
MKKHIPNFLTCLNLFSGCIGVYYAFQGNYFAVLIFILIAAFFDFIDGLAARLLQAYSPMGKEIDSLADVVSFGLAPGAVCFTLLSQSSLPFWLSFAGFIITLFSALRLAKFNIDERQSSSFLGLATPANAIFWVGLGYSFSAFVTENSWLILVLIVIFSALLVSEIPMFSLKFKNLKWEENELQYIFLMLCVLFLFVFQLNAFVPIIIAYLFLAGVKVVFKI